MLGAPFVDSSQSRPAAALRGRSSLVKAPLAAFFVRALRVGCRAKSTYALRFVMAVAIMFCLLVHHANMTLTTATGLLFLRTIVWINLLFLSVLGLGFFATVFTEERQQRTLGLLKLTGLSPLAILLGKSASRFQDALLIIVAQIPFVLLAVTLGGVAKIQIAAGFCTILAWAVGLCGFGLLCSVCFQRSDTASGSMGLAVLLFLFAPVCVQILGLCRPDPLVVTIMSCLKPIVSGNPFVAAEQIMATGFSGPLAGVQVASNLFAGVVSFLLAWAGFEVFTKEEREIASARRTALRRGRGWRDRWIGRVWTGQALAWKDYHFVASGNLHCVIKIVIYSLVLGVTLAMSSASDFEMIGATMMWLAAILATIHCIALTHLSLNSEIKQRTIAGIILLPWSTSVVICAKLGGCLLAVGPELLFFLLGAALAPYLLFDMFGEISYFALIAIEVGFILHLVALCSVAVKRGGMAVAFVTLALVEFVLLLTLIPFEFAGRADFGFGLRFILLAVMTVFLNREIVLRVREAAGA